VSPIRNCVFILKEDTRLDDTEDRKLQNTDIFNCQEWSSVLLKIAGTGVTGFKVS